MHANQSIKSSLIHTGLSTEKEESVRKFYQNFLRIMASASECGLDFQFDLQMKVKPAATEELPSAILDASASAAEERAEDMEQRHKSEMEGLRDTMRAECDKKCHDAKSLAYSTGYAFSEQRWNPVYKAVCEELELARKEGANHQDAYIRVCKERDDATLAQVDLRQELDEMEEDSEKLEAQIEALRMELASAKGNLEGTEVAARAMTASSTQVVEGLRKELTTTKADLIRAQNSAKNLEGEVDSATKLFQAMRSDLERVNAENKALRQEAEEDKQMVQRHLKEVAKQNAEMMAWETERLRNDVKELQAKLEERDEALQSEVAEYDTLAGVVEKLEAELAELQKKHAALLQLVNPTIKLMKSNPELFGGEALPSGPVSPKSTPLVTRWRAVAEEETERAEKFLKDLATLSRPCQLVESPPSSPKPPVIVRLPPVKEEEEERVEKFLNSLVRPVFRKDAVVSPALPGIVEAEGLCRAWRDEDEDQPKACGAAGCIECPAAEPAAEPVAVPVAEADSTRVCCVGCGKPKPDYNNPRWPSPKTKRFAKHMAKHTGKVDPKTISTHEGALEFLANWAKVPIDEMLKMEIRDYQKAYASWSLDGPCAFPLGTAPATWWS